ncbi:unnamed protein product [Debaryomyces tyrocola]|nr:unnamed protein product [Debaryomyces tyrocola]
MSPDRNRAALALTFFSSLGLRFNRPAMGIFSRKSVFKVPSL